MSGAQLERRQEERERWRARLIPWRMALVVVVLFGESVCAPCRLPEVESIDSYFYFLSTRVRRRASAARLAAWPHDGDGSEWQCCLRQLRQTRHHMAGAPPPQRTHQTLLAWQLRPGRLNAVAQIVAVTPACDICKYIWHSFSLHTNIVCSCRFMWMRKRRSRRDGSSHNHSAWSTRRCKS